MPPRSARTLAIGVISFLAILGLPWRGAAADLKPQIDRIVGPLVDGKVGRAIVIGIVTKDGRQMLGYGKPASPTATTPAGDILFEIGSLTKVFTTLLLAKMAQDGTVKLDDPVQIHLPKEARVPKRGDKQITLLHLATHTSGLPRLPPYFLLRLLFHPSDAENPYAHYTAKELYDSLAAFELERDPGDRVGYSNLGMGLLGNALVHTACSKDYQDLVVRRVCDPLGMKDTRIVLSADQQSRLAKGHDDSGKPTSPWDFLTLEGCGALRSSANDLLTFLSANIGIRETKLGPAMESCHQTRAMPGSKNLQLALGWQIDKRAKNAAPVLWHNGGTGGFRCFAGFVKETRTAVVVLSNSAEFDDRIDEIGNQVLDLLNDRGK